MGLQARHHHLIRFIALVVTVVAITYMAQRTGARTDVTAEGLSRLTPATEKLIASIAPERPVTVHAFVSDDVPQEYVPVRSRLLNVLNEMDNEGGAGLTVRIVAPELGSEEADQAADTYGIEPRTVIDRDGGRVGQMDIFMGLAFVSGPREESVSFMDRGLSVEYEIARALRMVIEDKKKVIGILRTDASIMGRFDFQTMSQQRPWSIVAELRKQYEVRGLDPAKDIGDDIDVLFVPQVSSLTQEHIDKVQAYVDAGRPALLTVDPLPRFDLRVSPSEPRLPPPNQQRGMFGNFGGGPQAEPKGDYLGFLRKLGIAWSSEDVLYDAFKPHAMLSHLPEQIIFVGARPDGTNPLAGGDRISDGLAEVVVMYGGELAPVPGDDHVFTPILTTGENAGRNGFKELVDRHPLFGLQGPLPPRRRSAITGQNHVMAARVERGGASGEDGEVAAHNVIVFADLDMFSNLFFSLYESGGDVDGDGLEDIRFDNVTLLLNAMDSLTGEDRFIELRKRRPKFRRLTTVDEMTREANKERDDKVDEANKKADLELAEAQQALENAVAAIRAREGLDATTKEIMIQSAEAAENRRLQAKTARIEREKKRAIKRTQNEHNRRVGEVQDRIRLLAVLLPPIPALLLGVFIFARKRRRERESIPRSRQRGGYPVPGPRNRKRTGQSSGRSSSGTSGKAKD